MDPAGKNLEGAPISDQARLEWLRWLKGEVENGKKFEHPKVEGDSISRYLDSITLEQHYMERFSLSRETVRAFSRRLKAAVQAWDRCSIRIFGLRV